MDDKKDKAYTPPPIEAPQQEKKSFFGKMFFGVTNSYSDSSQKGVLRMVYIIFAVAALASFFVIPSCRDTGPKFTQTGKRDVGSQITDGAHLTEEEKSEIIQGEEIKRLESRKEGKTFTPVRMELTRWKELAKNEPTARIITQHFMTAVEKAVVEKKTTEQAIRSGLIEVKDQADQLGLSKAETLSVVAQNVLNAALKLGKSKEEAIQMSAAAAFEAAIEASTSKRKAINIAAQAAFHSAKKTNMSDAEAIDQASKAAYDAAIKAGKTEEEARALAAKAAYDAALDAGMSEEEARKAAAMSAFNRAIEAGMGYEEALRASSKSAYDLAISQGLTHEQALAAAASAVLNLTKNRAVEKHVENQFNKQLARSLASGLSLEQSLIAAVEKAFASSIASGLGQFRSSLISINALFENRIDAEPPPKTPPIQIIKSYTKLAQKSGLAIGLSLPQATSIVVSSAFLTGYKYSEGSDRHDSALVNAKKTIENTGSELNISESNLDQETVNTISLFSLIENKEGYKGTRTLVDVSGISAYEILKTEQGINEFVLKLPRAIVRGLRYYDTPTKLSKIIAVNPIANIVLETTSSSSKSENHRWIKSISSIQSGAKSIFDDASLANFRTSISLARAIYFNESNLGYSETDALSAAATGARITISSFGSNAAIQDETVIQAVYEILVEIGYKDSDARKLARNVLKKNLILLGVSKEAAEDRAVKAHKKINQFEDSKNISVADAAKNAYELAIASGATEEEARLAAAKAVYQAALESGMSEEEAQKLASEALYKMAIDAGLTNEEALKAVGTFAYEQALAAGLSKEQALKAAASRVQETALRNGATLEAATKLASSTVYDIARAAGFSEEEARKRSAEIAYDLAKQYGATEEEALKIAAQTAFELAKKEGMTDEEAVLAAAAAAQAIGESKGWSKDRQVRAASIAAREAASEAGLSPQKIASLAGEAAQIAAKKAGLSASAQIKSASMGAASAAKHLGMTDEEIIESAANAAASAAQKLKLSEADVDREVRKNITLVSAKLGIDANTASASVNKKQNTANPSSGKTQPNTSGSTVDKRSEKREFTQKQFKKAISAYKLRKDEQKNDESNNSAQGSGVLGGVATTFTAPKKDDIPTTTDSADNDSTVNVSEEASETNLPVITMGSSSWGVVEYGVNTDSPINEIIGYIVGGPIDGATIKGVYERNSAWGDTVALKFTKANYLGVDIPVDFIAFHPDTRLPMFASSVDHHYIMRFTGFLVSAYTQGKQLEIQAQRQIETVRDQDSGVSDIQQPLATDLAKDLGKAKMIEEMAKVGEQYFARPITITVNRGDQMILVAMSNVFLPDSLTIEK